MTARRRGVVVAMALMAVTSSVEAQTPKGASAQGLIDADEAAPVVDRSPFEGRVLAYLLSPDARVAGLLFESGRQVILPPDAGRRVAEAIRPGQQVRVEAWPTDAADRPPATWPALTVVESGRRLAPDPPGAPPVSRPDLRPDLRPDPHETTLAAMQVGGDIDGPLRGPRGEVNGVRLTDGVQVFFPPHVALDNRSSLARGMRLDVEGFGRRSGYGTAVQATVITTGSHQTIRVYPRP